jgi:IS5 family transposase
MPAPRKISQPDDDPPIRLYKFLEALDLNEFRDRLPRGRTSDEKKYYPPEALVKALILRQLLNLTYRDLEKLLKVHREYRRACGFPEDYVPDYTYYCKFLKALRPSILELIIRAVLQQLSQVLTLSCRVIALDSGCFYAWANSFTKAADSQAKTGKSSTKGWFFGYKVHLAVDTETELPVALLVTPGNRYDGHLAVPLLDQVQAHLPRSIQAVIADKGYDAGYVYLDIIELFHALPIIPKRGEEDLRGQGQLTLDQFFPELPPVPAPRETPDRLERGRHYRQTPPLARDDDRWAGLMKLRLTAERAISRYKAFFCPEQLRTTRLRRVTNWCLLGWLALLGSALFLCQQNLPHLVRSFPYIF